MATSRHRRYGGTARTVLADYVSAHAREWATAWLEEVRTNPVTPRYRSHDAEELIHDTEALYNYLAIWLKSENFDERIETHYRRIGRARKESGFPLSEVARAIQLAKTQLWKGVAGERRLSTALELEVGRVITRFYDRAIYHTILGYEGQAP